MKRSMKKYLIATLSAVLFLNVAVAQPFTDEGKKVKVSRQVLLADELVRSGSYYNAIDIYLVEYQKDDDVYTAFQLANAYYLARDYKNSEPWFKKVWDKEPVDYPKAHYYYAMSLKMNGKYDAALTEFTNFKKTKMKGSDAVQFKRNAKNEAKGCELAKLLAAEPLTMEITHLGANINNNYTDFSPTYDPKTQNLVYASLVSKEVIDLGASKKVELKAKIFTAQRQGTGWTQGREMAGPFNELGSQVGNGAYSPDGKRFYFTQCDPNEELKMECKIFMCDFIGGEWGKPKNISDVNAGAGYTTTHPTVGIYKGKEYLYFSSNREGTVGGMDIWYSEVRDKGATHTAPQNVGRKINTPGDEITPFYSVIEDILYFSSNGLINIGGQDVFKTKGGVKSWDPALNVGMPVNTSVDDFYYTVDNKRARTGFLVSNRPGGFSVKSETCCDDIYELKYIIPPVFTIMGRVLDKADNTPVEGAAVTLFKGGTKFKMDSAENSLTKGFLFYRGTEFEKYNLTAIKDGYYQGQGKTTTVGLSMDEDDTVYVDILIEKIPIKLNIEIKNIYYELAKADLRPESYVALDSLLNVMTNNPAIIVEIGSHTDSRDSKEKNQDLSQRRAQSVVNYLLVKGIDSSRMVAKGYGEEVLKNKCKDGVKCTEEEHQVNRRTEFTIIGEIPNTNITYNQSEIDGFKALEREKLEKANAAKNQKMLDLQTLEEGDEEGTNIEDNTKTPETNTTNANTTTTTTTTDTKEKKKEEPKKEEVKPQGKAGVDVAIIKKGNMYEGTSVVNGVEETKYILNLNPSMKVVTISDEFFVKLRDAGTITDASFKNEKPTQLSDGSSAKGDILILKSLQLGETVLNNVEAKISLTSTANIVVGGPVVEANGCSFDTKNLKLKCK
ncbi:MAG: OmpA family protein [Chitinophagales bacterium]|nr:OmpA family protein [Chitinophagales bacterium]